MSSRSRTNTPRRSGAERGTEQDSGVAQRPFSASAQRQAVGAIIRDANPRDRLSLRWAIVPVLDEEAELAEWITWSGAVVAKDDGRLTVLWDSGLPQLEEARQHWPAVSSDANHRMLYTDIRLAPPRPTAFQQHAAPATATRTAAAAPDNSPPRSRQRLEEHRPQTFSWAYMPVLALALDAQPSEATRCRWAETSVTISRTLATARSPSRRINSTSFLLSLSFFVWRTIRLHDEKHFFPWPRIVQALCVNSVNDHNIVVVSLSIIGVFDLNYLVVLIGCHMQPIACVAVDALQ